MVPVIMSVVCWWMWVVLIGLGGDTCAWQCIYAFGYDLFVLYDMGGCNIDVAINPGEVDWVCSCVCIFVIFLVYFQDNKIDIITGVCTTSKPLEMIGNGYKVISYMGDMTLWSGGVTSTFWAWSCGTWMYACDNIVQSSWDNRGDDFTFRSNVLKSWYDW